MLSFLTAFWKVFGVAPPQTLYHTRKADSPTPQSPVSVPALPVDIDTPAVVPLEPFSFFMQGFGKKFRRSTTPDSSRALISRSETINSIEIYNSYHDSLNSLVSIVDNVSPSVAVGVNYVADGSFSSQDDKASLKVIHDILHANDGDDGGMKRKVDDDDDYDSSDPDIPSPATTRDDRRRSLPLCPSMTSMRSEYSITSPPPEVSTFEQKRRRAAKLTNFFGVNHRDIMTDILESIESGVAEEMGRGTLNEAQADVRSISVFRVSSRAKLLLIF
jgi:hypothetical protein